MNESVSRNHKLDIAQYYIVKNYFSCPDKNNKSLEQGERR